MRKEALCFPLSCLVLLSFSHFFFSGFGLGDLGFLFLSLISSTVLSRLSQVDLGELCQTSQASSGVQLSYLEFSPSCLVPS